MKILVMSSHTPSLKWFRMDMMKEFIRLGNEVVAVGNESEEKWGDQYSEEGIRYRQALIQRNGTNPIKDLATLKDLRRIIREEKPDKIFTYQAKTVIYGGLAAKKEKIKEVYPLIAGTGSVFMAKGIKAKFVSFILKTEYKLALKHANNVFFQNDDDIAFFVDNKIVKSDKVKKINGSGVNLERFTRQEMPNQVAFLFIGRLIKDKGIFEYLEAAKAIKADYPQVKFYVVGPYDSNPSALKEEELKPYVENGIIEYFGEQSDVRPYFEKCSVFVLPSYREGTPKTVLEAMACGKAVITTDAPGCRETVENNVNGFLVPVKDVNAIIDKIKYFIDNPQSVIQMADKGQEIVKEKYDVKKVNYEITKTMGLIG